MRFAQENLEGLDRHGALVPFGGFPDPVILSEAKNL